MPYKVGTINAVNVLFVVLAGSDWRSLLREALLATSSREDSSRVEEHMEMLRRRWSGELDWTAELPPPVSRAYNSMLLKPVTLPLYRHGPIRFTVDLHNPGNEAAAPDYDPGFVEVELLVHRHEIYPWERGTMPDGTKVNYGDPAMFGRQSVCGEALGDLAARWAEILRPHFAFADMQYAGAGFLKRATDANSVSNPAPPGTRYWDYLWSLSYWSPELLTEKLEARLKALEFTQAQRAKFDSFWGRGIRPTWRALSTGGLLVQYRFIFAESRGSRSLVDTPLAKQAGLRTTNLVYRR